MASNLTFLDLIYGVFKIVYISPINISVNEILVNAYRFTVSYTRHT